MGRVFGVLLATALLATAQGCGAGKCDQAVVDRATTFIAQHQSCATDADCVVISDYCQTLPNGYCGQLVMSRAGKESAEWGDLDHELSDCGPSKCTVCLAALIPACHAGSCKGPG